MCCVVTQCLRALLVSDKHLALAHCRQDVLYCNGNHLNFHLFKFIETDGGIEPAVLGIFAVQCNIQAGEALLCIHYLQEALSQNLNSEISVCTDNT